jgi:hypothetical protein
MVKSWQELEDLVCDLLENDNPVKPKGSGSTKKEEDVVGTCIIAQCKYTENKNMYLSDNDIDRLKSSAKLQDKFPIFVNSNGKDTVISFIVNNDTKDIVSDTIDIIILNKCSFSPELIRKVNNLKTLEQISKAIDGLSKITVAINNKSKEKFDKVKRVIQAKFEDLTTHNLFD